VGWRNEAMINNINNILIFFIIIPFVLPQQKLRMKAHKRNVETLRNRTRSTTLISDKRKPADRIDTNRRVQYINTFKVLAKM